MADLIFTKYSNERCRRFSIRTDILEENGKRFVRKTALFPEGQEHIRKIYDWYQQLEKRYGREFFCFNHGVLEDESLLLDYVEGQTLEELLDELLLDGESETAENRLREYLTKVEKMYSGESFVVTDEFREVFGDAEFSEKMDCADVTNIDMVCSNLVLAKEPTVLDYEWTFDFPVPGKYVLYRIIRYSQDLESVRKYLGDVDFYEDYGITREMKLTFDGMEGKFQEYITGGHFPMREMYDDMNPGNAPLQIDRAEQLQIFFNLGDGYCQENSVRYPIREKKVSVKADLPSGCRTIRLDPGDSPCAVYLSRITFDGKDASLKNTVVEGGYRFDRWVYIAKTDPYIADIQVPDGAGEIAVQLHVYPVEQKVLESMIRQFSSGKASAVPDGKRLLSRIKKCLHR